MGLPTVIEGSNHRPLELTWDLVDQKGAFVKVLNLTGATLSAYIKEANSTDPPAPVSGTLNVVSAVDGTFTWQFGASDIATRGTYEVQFIATFADTTKDRSFKETFIVEDALDV